MEDSIFRNEDVFQEDARQGEIEKREDENRRMRRDYQTVFGSPAGMRVLEDIVIGAGYIFTPYGQLPANRLEGRRELALYILGRLGLTENINSIQSLLLIINNALKGKEVRA